MTPKKPKNRSFLYLLFVMTAVVVIAAGSAIAILYQTAIREEGRRLVDDVTGQASLIDSMALRYEKLGTGKARVPGGVSKILSVLGEIIQAHGYYKGARPGATGSVALAMKDGDRFVLFRRDRDMAPDQTGKLIFVENAGEPLRLALLGKTGVYEGPDYRGVAVMAAYTPVPGLGAGMAVKINLAEIRSPFIRAGLWTVAVSFFTILAAATLFRMMTNVITRRINEYEERIIELALIPEQNPGPVMRIDVCGTIRYANSHCKPFLKTWNIGPGDRAPYEWRLHVSKTIKENKNREIEHIFQDKVFSLLLVPVAEGKYVNIYGSDITERKQAEAKLVIAKEEADFANRAKSELLSSMSHELRTPLNAIIGFGQLLEHNPNESVSDTQRDQIHQILKGGEHLLQLINEILDLSRIEAGKIEFHPEQVSPRIMFDECLAFASPLGEKCRITIEDRTADQKLPPVLADPIRFKQALLNLLSNAVKYNRDEGKVFLDARVTGDGMLRMTVTDTGKGIPPERLDELFHPFNRLGAEAGGIEGTGIGLTITRKIVEMMGGRIGFDSTVGEGSRFWIALPVDDGRAAEGEYPETGPILNSATPSPAEPKTTPQGQNQLIA